MAGLPLNALFPFLALAGTGVYCFPMARRLHNRPRALFLMFIGACLVLLGALFLIPVVSAVAASLFWFFLKVSLIVYSMIWFRATWPRFRYDQLMNIGWCRLNTPRHGRRFGQRGGGNAEGAVGACIHL